MSSNAINRPGFGPIAWRLAAKDFWLIRWPLLGYAAMGAIAILLISINKSFTFHAGLVLLVSALAVAGAHLVFASTLHEKTNQTLPFLLSLPISFLQYTWSKLLFTIGTFFLFWLALTLGIFAVVSTRDFLVAGMLPYDLIVLTYLAMAFVLTLAVAMMTESAAWTIVTMSVCNMSISLFMITMANLPGLVEHINGPVAVWNTTAIGILAGEVFLMILFLGLTILVQSRKSEFL